MAELVVVAEEMGRALLCSPFFSSICLAGSTLLAVSTEEEKADLLPGIAAGSTIATLALTEPTGTWDLAEIGMSAVATEDGLYRLDGTKTFVPDGLSADLILVAARVHGSTGTDGISLFAVAGDAPGLTRTALPTMDLTRKPARLDFVGVRARPIGAVGEVGPALSAALDEAAICLAAEQVGGAEKCLEMAVEYAKIHVQFGRPARQHSDGSSVTALQRQLSPPPRAGRGGRRLTATGCPASRSGTACRYRHRSP